jgi:hypothetical protein
MLHVHEAAQLTSLDRLEERLKEGGRAISDLAAAERRLFQPRPLVDALERVAQAHGPYPVLFGAMVKHWLKDDLPDGVRELIENKLGKEEFHHIVADGFGAEWSVEPGGIAGKAWMQSPRSFREIAPTLDPQDWDAVSTAFPLTFGLDKATYHMVPHTPADAVRLPKTGYRNQLMHEEVALLSLTESCDLNIDYFADGDSPDGTPNHATYSLRFSHNGDFTRNQGEFHVDAGSRVTVTKDVLMTDPLKLELARLILPLWMLAILEKAYS